MHRHSLTIDPGSALRTVGAEPLGLAATDPLPDVLLLIEEPEEAMPPGAALSWAWQRLFHARVHAAIDLPVRGGRARRRRDRPTDRGDRPEGVRRDPIGARSRRLAHRARDDGAVYGEFAAVFLELRHFSEELLPAYFPGIEDFGSVAAVIERDVDGFALFDATRPAGADDPAPHPVQEDQREVAPLRDDAPERSERRYRWLIARADRARALGNIVRSAILRTRAARLVGPSLAGQARSGSADDLMALSRRLAEALGLRVDPTR